MVETEAANGFSGRKAACSVHSGVREEGDVGGLDFCLEITWTLCRREAWYLSR